MLEGQHVLKKKIFVTFFLFISIQDGTLDDFQFLAVANLVAYKTWHTSVWLIGGMVSIPIKNKANSGMGPTQTLLSGHICLARKGKACCMTRKCETENHWLHKISSIVVKSSDISLIFKEGYNTICCKLLYETRAGLGFMGPINCSAWYIH